MKIICIGRNYAEHIEELYNPRPAEPVVFLKPDTALVPKGNPLFLPPFSRDVHYETEIVVRISRLGKGMEPRFARRYYDAIGLGLDITARDIQQQLKQRGLPWEKAKAFDFSALVSDTFIPVEHWDDIQNIDFSLHINGRPVQQGNTARMLWPVDELVAYVSQFFTLRTGDLLFTGTPAGTGPLHRNDILEGFIGKRSMFKIRVK
jgi:2-keto-4-pentenoate hydratase/2-oxohepta-3-ene-1,7-dioic acid hydratase in catechol pathway